MKKRNSAGRLLAILLAALLVPAMTACSAKDGDQMTEQTEKTEQSETGSVTSDEPQNEEEALALYRELMEQENKILSENTDLWEKVYLEADKGMAMLEDGKNYGEFLLKTIEAAKDQFTEEELKTLQSEAEKISELESRLTMLEEKYPEVAQKYLDSGMSMEADSDDADSGMSMPADSDDADSGMSMPADSSDNSTETSSDDSNAQKFPDFEGKDLDGNEVKSSELFAGNAVTVVNFWFTTCGPCVGELSELDALNKELEGKGGALIGVNSFTLDGNENEIAEAKDVLAKNGAAYQNVYFASDSEAGKFTMNIYAYPTTYVVDRNGNLVGDPIVGAITEKKQKKMLEDLIDQALAADQQQ